MWVHFQDDYIQGDVKAPLFSLAFAYLSMSATDLVSQLLAILASLRTEHI